jgi:hypothetical protein
MYQLRVLDYYRNSCIWGRLHHSSALSDDRTIFKGLQRAFWPDFVDNKNILDVSQCQPDMRNLQKHKDMFLETSLYGKIPFWDKHSLFGGKGVLK